MGQLEWQPSPGGLVTALEPVMRKAGGAWIGWSGRRRAGPGGVLGGRPGPGWPGPVRDRGQVFLRGLLQRDAVAALPRRHRAAAVPPNSIENLMEAVRRIKDVSKRWAR